MTRRGGAWYLDGSLGHKELKGGGAVIVFKNRFVNFAWGNLKEITVLKRKKTFCYDRLLIVCKLLNIFD